MFVLFPWVLLIPLLMIEVIYSHGNAEGNIRGWLEIKELELWTFGEIAVADEFF